MPATALLYPFEAPAFGDWLEVAPGVCWIRLPLPFKLDHINVYGVEDGEGWALIDTGLHDAATVAAWTRVLSNAPHDRPLSRVFVTHMHLDHVGMAGWLNAQRGAPLHMTEGEFLGNLAGLAESGRAAPESAIDFYRAAGWDEGALEGYRARYGQGDTMVSPPPSTYSRLEDGQVVRIGAHDWEVVVGTGHSPEHACLYCPSLKLFASGDQVLPKISSNVSLSARAPGGDPMADWNASLDRIEARVPDDVLVLPAHNLPFRGLHARLQSLRAGQAEALDRLRPVLATPQRAVDTFTALFKRPIGPADTTQFSLATGEALANLRYLVNRGEAVQEMRDGVAYYRLA